VLLKTKHYQLFLHSYLNFFRSLPCWTSAIYSKGCIIFAGPGSSTDVCSFTYRGSSPASELETKAVQREGVRLGPTLLTSIHIHTYGQYWLIPWAAADERGGLCVYARDHADMVSRLQIIRLHSPHVGRVIRKKNCLCGRSLTKCVAQSTPVETTSLLPPLKVRCTNGVVRLCQVC